MVDVCLLTLCGLPASGKTSFVKAFKKYLRRSANSEESIHNNNLHKVTDDCLSQADANDEVLSTSHYPLNISHICYDNIMPRDIEVELLQHNTVEFEEAAQESRWKVYRRQILLCVDNLLDELTPPELRECGRNEDEKGIPPDLQLRFRNVVIKKLDMKALSSDRSRLVVVIDDNMFYSSMRYQVYQLARKHSAAYAQIYFPSEVHHAVQRNSERRHQVASDVIVSMATRMEAPDANNSWEKRTAFWSMEDCKLSNFAKVTALIDEALLHPLAPSSEYVDEHEAIEARVTCSTNVVHQADCILRRLLSEHIANFQDGDPSSKSENAAKVNIIRRGILDDMRSGQVLVPRHVAAAIENAANDAGSPLYGWVRDIFLQRLTNDHRPLAT